MKIPPLLRDVTILGFLFATLLCLSYMWEDILLSPRDLIEGKLEEVVLGIPSASVSSVKPVESSLDHVYKTYGLRALIATITYIIISSICICFSIWTVIKNLFNRK
jgi:hypothetical protein